ncbi:hypothetical protein CRG98_001946 [Punica granatum]|uniref:Uncharacterized protein n=1 Tax=Punica granatum TaxID=22663 RepID=A0A2I0LAF0_PUNGR|nr:hypothetical protein CRG98_001946 [Punica granatum]
MLGDFKRDLIVHPAQDLGDLSARAKRYVTLEKSLAAKKKGHMATTLKFVRGGGYDKSPTRVSLPKKRVDYESRRESREGDRLRECQRYDCDDAKEDHCEPRRSTRREPTPQGVINVIFEGEASSGTSSNARRAYPTT